MTPDQAPVGTTCRLKNGTSQWAAELDVKVLEWGNGQVKLYPGGWKSVEETKRLTVAYTYPSKNSQPAYLLAEACEKLMMIERLVVGGLSCENMHHKQFFFSQVLKLIDEEAWKNLGDKGIPPN